MTDDALVGRARCINVADDQARSACFGEIAEARGEQGEECRAQLRTRLGACDLLGQDRYDPDLDPALFDDPRNPSRPNPYFPLVVGHRWEYVGEGETNTIEVLDEVKGIAGVDCIVLRDRVLEGGDLIEDTDDWFCPAKDGTVWYFGEEVKDFESFDEDDPRLPELVSIDGSFKAGRDGDEPGIIFPAEPQAGDVYREEFSLGNAEDVGEVLSTTYGFPSGSDLDEKVPGALAMALCAAGDCVVTKNFSLLEPGSFARKYYASGIGFFLEVAHGSVVAQLVSCSFDPRCSGLPQP